MTISRILAATKWLAISNSSIHLDKTKRYANALVVVSLVLGHITSETLELH